jgi:maleylpyruvate isomerase
MIRCGCGDERMAGTRGRREDIAVDSDPGRLLARIQAATGRLAVTAGTLTDAQAREPSLLPGWTRGHVLTHIARNADGLGNLLVWARTGVETPQYPSRQAREDGIEAGAHRPAAELAADVRQSAAEFAGQVARVPATAWDVPVHGLNGPDHPAWFTLFRRLAEVEIHHADLGAGYGPSDWPSAFVADELERVTGQFAGRDDVPACVLELAGTGQRFRLGPGPAAAPEGAATVAGPGWRVLAWLTGRDDGAALTVSGGPDPAGGQGGLPPKLPKWS